MRSAITRQVELIVSPEYLREVLSRIEKSGSSGEVALVAPRPGGKVLLHTKSFYPDNTYRLPTGKLLQGEDPEDAFHREFLEELGIIGSIRRLIGVITYKLIAKNEDFACFTSYIYLARETSETPMPQDEDEQITGFIEVPADDLVKIAAELESLPGRWSDWGRFRAVAHRFIAEILHLF